jgi:hypothetical protein
MPIHRYGLYSRPNPHWHRRLHKDAQNLDRPPRIPPLHPEICSIREAAREPGRPRQSGIPCRGGRYGYSWAMQTSQQDRKSH